MIWKALIFPHPNGLHFLWLKLFGKFLSLILGYTPGSGRQDHDYTWSRTRKGGWVVAQSPILTLP